MEVLTPISGYSEAAVDASDAAHEALSVELAAAGTSVARLFRAIQLRRLLEAAAGIGAIEIDQTSPTLLLPPRRRWLSGESLGRFDGVAMGLRHVDSRVVMVRTGAAPSVIEAETPMVINAFSESRDPGRRETNAGSIRAGDVSFLDVGADFLPPSPERCRPLLRTVTDVLAARPAPAPPIIMGAWGSLMIFAIHPFVDGNGRTARLLFQAVHSEGLASGFDWGSLGEWALARAAYIEAIQRAINVFGDDPPPESSLQSIRPEPFFDFVISRSVGGANRALARLRHIEAMYDRWASDLGEAAETFAFVAFERNVADDEFAEIGDRVKHVTTANELADAGALVRDGRGRWNITPAVSA